MRTNPERHHLLITTWKPQPICKPTINREFQQLDALSRSTECIRYSLLSVEYWLSPDGHLREWLRVNCRLFAWLIIPCVLVMPVIGCILWQVTGWLPMVQAIVGKLIILPIFVLLMLMVIRAALAFLKR